MCGMCNRISFIGSVHYIWSTLLLKDGWWLHINLTWTREVGSLVDDIELVWPTCQSHQYRLLLSADSLANHTITCWVMIQLLVWFHLIFLAICIIQKNVITVWWHSHASQRLLLEDNCLPFDLAGFFRSLIIADVRCISIFVTIYNWQWSTFCSWLFQARLSWLGVSGRLLSKWLIWSIHRCEMVFLSLIRFLIDEGRLLYSILFVAVSTLLCFQ